MSSHVFPTWNDHAVLTCAEMRRAEEMTYASGAPSFSLMQRAGEVVAKVIQERRKPCRTLVLCGPGNNGGDGFVIAEMLRKAGWNVSVAAMTPPANMKGDALQAAKAWQGPTVKLEDVSFDGVELVVDALFGTGLARKVEGAAIAALEKLSYSKAPVVAVDLPSGVDGDLGRTWGAAPQAEITVTFFRKKLGHLLLPAANLCGEVVVGDIGISAQILDQIKPKTTENKQALWCEGFPFPKAEGHKYARGHALIYGGAVMTGAAKLAARAAQRMGAGLITLGTPQAAVPAYEVLESVIVRAANDMFAWKELLNDEKKNALLIGPGLGLGAQQKDFVLAALETKKPCVLDADALSNFAEAPDDVLSKLHEQCVLTPHEGEFARLFGKKIDVEADKLTRARKAAALAKCTVLLKGADTVIARPDGYAIINANAPAWLATAGAGDVLAGMILGLVAQGMNVYAATAAGAWLHGAVATDFGPGLIAEDLVAGIPQALKALVGAKN